jgi:hypothetical protein
MRRQFNSNANDFKAFDEFVGGKAITAIGSAVGGGFGGAIATGVVKSGVVKGTGLGTAIRYGLGGGMDTINF